MKLKTSIYPRIILDLILLLGIFYFPFWLTVAFSIALVLYFENYYEFIIAYFVIDLVYGTKEPKFFNIQYVLTIISLAIFFLIKFVKSKLIGSKFSALKIK